jgi:hypothetical protein
VEEPDEELFDEPDEAPAKHAPVMMEVEYWWDTSGAESSNGAGEGHENTATSGWLPEPVIHTQHP